MLQPTDPPAEREDDAIRGIIELLRTTRGADFAAYRPATLSRRIALQAHAAGCATLEDYAERLRADSTEPDRLLTRMLIKVSSVFRDTAFYRTLEQVLIERAAERPEAKLKLWSAGCAHGEEAYTLAILLADAFGPVVDPLLATDLDPAALKIATAGCYDPRVVQNVPPDRLAAHFEPTRRGSRLMYQVRPQARESVRFVQHDLASNTAPEGAPFDVVLCRNVLIYWSKPVRERMEALLVRSLAPRGILCLGPAEWLASSLTQRFEVLHGRHRILPPACRMRRKSMGRHELSIRGRLALGFGIVFLLICAEAAVFGGRYAKVNRLDARQRAVILPAYETVRDLRTDVLRRAVALRSYALTGDTSFRNTADALEKQQAQAQDRLTQLDATADKALIAQIATSLNEYATTSHHFVALVEQNAPLDEITGVERTLDHIRGDLIQDAERLIRIESARLDKTNAEIEDARDEARTSLLLCWLLVAAAAGVTGVLTARAVRRPALELLVATRALRKGNFGPAIELAPAEPSTHHANELRELADAFGLTAVALRDREQSIRALAAELAGKNELLKEQNESLQEQTEEIQAQNEELQAQTEEIQAQNEELRAREEELQNQNSELEQQKDELSVLHRQKDQFLSIASHELRTPITTLKLHAYQVVRRSADHPEWQPIVPSIRAIDVQATRLNELVTRMLDASRATGRRIELRKRQTDLAELARLATSQAQVRTTRHRVTISGATEPVIGHWDSGYLEQVFTNLLENAIRYSPEGGEIAVALDERDDAAVLSVTDHGIGISEEAQQRLFRPYFRSEGARTITSEGLGLGLYVTREIVQAHGGTISVRSRPGIGTTFTVTLPRQASDEVGMAAVAASA